MKIATTKCILKLIEYSKTIQARPARSQHGIILQLAIMPFKTVDMFREEKFENLSQTYQRYITPYVELLPQLKT